MKKYFVLFLFVLIIAFIVIRTTGHSYLIPAIYYNYADVDDYKIFENREVKNSASINWYKGASYNSIQPNIDLRKKLELINTTSLVVVRNDSLLYEEYWDDYNSQTISNSFSVAKSIVSILTGIALQEGAINSLDDKVCNYVKEFNHDRQKDVTIKNLLTMTSGTDWDESYSSPFSSTTKLYYGDNIRELVTASKIIDAPGSKWIYKSADTELLSLVIEEATGKKLSDYASEKLWKPLKAEQTALWSIDAEDGIEKAYCCFNATAKDFARIGVLYLNKGTWKGERIINEDYISQSLKPVLVLDDENQTVNYYGYQWWLLPDREGIFYARGILGQYIIVIPQKKCVVVRLGKERGEKINNSFSEVYELVDWILKEY
jgi:CubicO group peptidase (beta-lactamase class C family)